MGYIGVGSSEESGVVKRQKKEQCYLVQEFINGGSLKAKIWRQSSSLSPLYSDHDAVQWGQQIAEGLAYLHSANPVVPCFSRQQPLYISINNHVRCWCI